MEEYQRTRFKPTGQSRWDLAIWRATGNPYNYVDSLLNNGSLLPTGVFEGGEDIELIYRKPQRRNPSVKPLWEVD